MRPLDLSQCRSLVVVTGAGISVASGLRPYRGAGGLWNDDPGAAELATARAFAERPADVWRLFGAMRADVARAAPNAAHRALADVERRLAGRCSVTILTQNVDSLHQRAGSTDTVELHGNVRRTRCSMCAAPPFDDDAAYEQGPPLCAACGGLLRPDVVLFDEALPVDAERRAKHALRDVEVFLAIGTSGTVWPAASFVRSAEYSGARTIYVNPAPNLPPNAYFHDEVIGRAEDVLPALLGVDGG